MPALSTSELVGDVAKAAVEDLALTGVAADQVVKRKLPSVPEGTTPALPQVVISVGEERVERLDALRKVKTYTGAATVVTAGGQKSADDPTVRDWRERIERKLEARATWAGVAGFSHVAVVPKLPFDPAALSKDWNYAPIGFEVEVVEDHADGS